MKTRLIRLGTGGNRVRRSAAVHTDIRIIDEDRVPLVPLFHGHEFSDGGKGVARDDDRAVTRALFLQASISASLPACQAPSTSTAAPMPTTRPSSPPTTPTSAPTPPSTGRP